MFDLFFCRVFGFVARKQGSSTDNACHLFAELDPEQPASAIVNFVTKVMIGSSKGMKSWWALKQQMWLVQAREYCSDQFAYLLYTKIAVENILDCF